MHVVCGAGEVSVEGGTMPGLSVGSEVSTAAHWCSGEHCLA